jgi:hypothetical protein
MSSNFEPEPAYVAPKLIDLVPGFVSVELNKTENAIDFYEVWTADVGWLEGVLVEVPAGSDLEVIRQAVNNQVD